MKYTYSDWAADHLKENEKIETVVTGQFSIIEEKSTEPERTVTVAVSTEEATEKTAEGIEKTIEATNIEESKTKDNLKEKETTTYKYRGGYHSKKD